MGTVYAAEDLTGGQTVAIKLLDPRLAAAGADNLRRFRREARAASAIKTEHIVRIFDASDDAKEPPYIAMELLEGEDLQQVIDRLGPLPPEHGNPASLMGLPCGCFQHWLRCKMVDEFFWGAMQTRGRMFRALFLCPAPTMTNGCPWEN